MNRPTAKQGSPPERFDSIRVDITPAIQEAAVHLLAAVIAEIRYVWPEATDADRRRVAINVMQVYWNQQANGYDIHMADLIRFPFPPIEPPDAG
jgi:hypothetical protein